MTINENIKFPIAALVGSPNTGKTALFNALTGSKQKTGNFPGITVEKKQGLVNYEDNILFEVYDLPGLYSLDTRTLDEKVTKDVLFGKDKSVPSPDIIIAVADATNLDRSLYLPLEVKNLGIPTILVLNLWDLACKRGQKINLEKLSAQIGLPIITTNSLTGEGVIELCKKVLKIHAAHQEKPAINLDFSREYKTNEFVKKTFLQIDAALKDSVETKIKPDSLTHFIDSIVLHPIWGSITLTVVLLILFQTLFTWSGPFSDMIENGLSLLSGFINAQLPESLFRSLITDGIIAGVGGVLVFLPQIIFLFAIILFLEDFGYLGRAAFMLDSIMRRLGLPGKAVVPLLSSHACALPGIMAARTIENERDRLATMMVTPLITCSARLPVYTLLIASFVPHTKILGPLELPAMVMMGLYFLGIISSFIIAYVFKKTMLKGSPTLLLMELPGYRMPSFKSIALRVLQRAGVFIKRAGTIILGLSIVIWILSTFPNYKASSPTEQINTSYAATIGRSIEPFFRPLGFDWKITTSLIPGLGAREVVVTSLATIMAVEGTEEELEAKLSDRIRSEFGIPSLLALLIWYVFSPQCISTFAVLKRETNSWKWPLVMLGYTTALAYGFAFLTYQISKLFFI